jgi:3-oxoacyl-[acyl-carrier protein] reductase
MKQELLGKVAIVTGSGQWIGRAIALRLAEEGADLMINDIVPERANKVAEEIRSLGRKAITSNADVTNTQQIEEMVKVTIAEFGKIDILVNNARAGGGSGGAKSPLFCDSTEEGWNNTILGSLTSTRHCCRAVINHMIERRSGKIINISSGAGVRGNPGASAYSAAKAGVIGLTMALSEEVVQYGVRVNCVSPAPSGSAVPGTPERAKKMAELSGLGREGKPEDVAAVVAVLASDAADGISGQNYCLGGMHP